MQPDVALSRIQGECTTGALAQATDVAVKSPRGLNAARITLLNWNIYKGQRENWYSDFNSLIADQDIVILQEALLDKHLFDTLKMHHLHWNLNTAFYYDDMDSGVLTASRIQAISSCGMRAIEPIIRIPKTILLSTYSIHNRNVNLLVANIHGINFSLGTESYQQQMSALTAAMENHHGPIIVAGDFNSWSDNRMDIVNDMAKTLFLTSVAYKNHNRSTIFGNAIDHVFYRGLELIEEDTFKVNTSDHNPIKVTFRMPATHLASITHE